MTIPQRFFWLLCCCYLHCCCSCFSSPNLCDQVREEFQPCLVSAFDILPPPPSPECCSALRALTHDDACACTTSKHVRWSQLASSLLYGQSPQMIPNWPAIDKIPFQCDAWYRSG
ncbi:hypothetical protein SELMODRAFT_403494 [Selaginella moellendorffii]|uniref:Bifunctional inhibitor/plant lipid transfer protein/seed storage helical domain-containing protein n=1 Tax=Selaginella moellendorffii TaxID=88036 RepID=D8QRL1_SELML|nr:hypothetical protein SELMODRAFT_403494 [Selaginella moellendorffii]